MARDARWEGGSAGVGAGTSPAVWKGHHSRTRQPHRDVQARAELRRADPSGSWCLLAAAPTACPRSPAMKPAEAMRPEPPCEKGACRRTYPQVRRPHRIFMEYGTECPAAPVERVQTPLRQKTDDMLPYFLLPPPHSHSVREEQLRRRFAPTKCGRRR